MIKINSLGFARPTRTIFDNFSCVIEQNCATLLTGANGAGKTTLINLIGGVLKPSAGSITINGLNLATLSPSEQSRLRSIAPQRRTFELAFTVEEILSFLPSYLLSSHADDVRDALGLNELSDLKVTELSVGQQQRVSVGLALIQEAPFYLLDEPFSAQDTSHATSMLDLLIQLSKEHGVVVVAHNAGIFKARFKNFLEIPEELARG